MWNQKTDALFLEMRQDAVLIFDKKHMKLQYLNPAAKILFPDAGPDAAYADLLQSPAIDLLIEAATPPGKVSGLTLEQQPWFPESAVLHAVETTWKQKKAIAVTIDRRAYGPPPEALQMMKAVLTSAYFSALRVDLRSGQVSVISDKNPLMNTQAVFPSFSEYINLYTEAVIHPEDREQLLSAFSEEQLHLFRKMNTSPSCMVRRLSGEEYRWASYTLTIVNQDIVLMFGKDSNEQHLQKERSDRYRAELKEMSLRNQYIISGVSDIFRLMLHIDLRTGATIVCSLHPDLERYYSEDTVYQYEDISRSLVRHVHPEDREIVQPFLSMNELCRITSEKENRLSFEYRRLHPDGNPDTDAKWTRAVFTLTAFSDGKPTEAIYAVQDIDSQKRRELEAKRRQESLSAQFNTLIRNRFVWFIENDYRNETSYCYRITNHMVQPPNEIPFGQFFERMIMPHCHPEDFKRVAMALLPQEQEKAYRNGTRKTVVEYRHKSDQGWRYVRAEIYLEMNAEGDLRTLTYISDINDEVQKKSELIRSEHEQLILRRKFSMMVQDSFLQVSEVDLDADTISHYHLDRDDFIPVPEKISFSEYLKQYPERCVHPDQCEQFSQMFSYDAILRAARESKSDMKHLFLIDAKGTQNYRWCNVAAKFSRDENGKQYVMIYVEDVDNEIRKRDANLHALSAAKKQLQEHLQEKERSRIRKAHVFLNIASSFQLSLNQIYGTLDQLEHSLPENNEIRENFRTMFTAYEHLSAMTECAKDVLLLENNQLPMLSEPVSLMMLTMKMKLSSGKIFEEKKLRPISYVTHVTDETVLCDSGRLTFLLENIFFNVIRSLPDGSALTLQLAESPINGDNTRAMYEFSLITHGDSASQDIQSGMLAPIPLNDPMRSVQDAFLFSRPDYQQHNLYLSKRLISLMEGSLHFVRLPAHGTAITLRLPFTFVPKQVLFPLQYTFGKRALVWDSYQAAAIATMEMLRESGFRSEWQADFGNLCAHLRMSAAQGTPYDLIVLRQTDLDAAPDSAYADIYALAPNVPVLVIQDAQQKLKRSIPAQMHLHELKTPLFRSTLATQLRIIFTE